MYAFVEACYFENCNQTITTDSTGAKIKLYASEFVSCNYDTSNKEIVKVTKRSDVVDNSNFMNRDGKTSGYSIDNDSNLFYLNSDGTTKALLDTATAAKWKCVNNAGVHKSSGWIDIADNTKLNQVFPLV